MNHKTTAKSYDKQSESYEKKWHGYLNNTHKALHAIIELQKDDAVLDVSAGTGLFAQQILEDHPVERIVLNDVSQEMQSLAKSRLADHRNVTFTSYSAENLDLRLGSFDHIISLNAYHNYPHQLQFLQKAFDLLEPGGYLYVLDWNKKGYFRVVNWLISKVTNEIINTKSADEVQQQLEATGFDVLTKKEWRYRYWELFLIKCQKP